MVAVSHKPPVLLSRWAKSVSLSQKPLKLFKLWLVLLGSHCQSCSSVGFYFLPRAVHLLRNFAGSRVEYFSLLPVGPIHRLNLHKLCLIQRFLLLHLVEPLHILTLLLLLYWFLVKIAGYPFCRPLWTCLQYLTLCHPNRPIFWLLGLYKSERLPYSFLSWRVLVLQSCNRSHLIYYQVLHIQILCLCSSLLVCSLRQLECTYWRFRSFLKLFNINGRHSTNRLSLNSMSKLYRCWGYSQLLCF